MPHDIRALYIKEKSANTSGAGVLEITVAISDSLDGSNHGKDIVIDLGRSLWGANLNTAGDRPARGEIVEIGRCGTGIHNDECFAVIDINDDDHIHNAAQFVGLAVTGRLKLMRRP